MSTTQNPWETGDQSPFDQGFGSLLAYGSLFAYFFKSTAFFVSIFFLRLRLKSLQLLSNKIVHPYRFLSLHLLKLNVSFIVSHLLKNVFEYKVDSPWLLFSSPQFLEQYVESQGYWWTSVSMTVVMIAVSRRVVKNAPWGREWCRKLQPG